MGPLAGYRIIEFAGIGAAPYGVMLLSDLGAEVIRIDRTSEKEAKASDVLSRGRRSISIDIRTDSGRDVALKLCETADAVIEAFRPGVMERLGLGPVEVMAANPRVIYARMTGWGQTGPLSKAAGHDPNYVAITGALHAIGPANGKPVLPLNLLGDFGGGGLMLSFGVVCALLERERSGCGQVIDAAMVDGAASLMALIYGKFADGSYHDLRGSNLLDGGAHFIDVYETSDGKFITIAALEKQFYDLFLKLVELDPSTFEGHMDPGNWVRLKPLVAEKFKTRTRDEWCNLLEGTDVCFAPVLSLAEAPHHHHNVKRRTFQEYCGVVQPSPAPRFNRTPGSIAGPPPARGAHTVAVLSSLGLQTAEIERLLASKIVMQA